MIANFLVRVPVPHGFEHADHAAKDPSQSTARISSSSSSSRSSRSSRISSPFFGSSCFCLSSTRGELPPSVITSTGFASGVLRNGKKGTHRVLLFVSSGLQLHGMAAIITDILRALQRSLTSAGLNPFPLANLQTHSAAAPFFKRFAILHFIASDRKEDLATGSGSSASGASSSSFSSESPSSLSNLMQRAPVAISRTAHSHFDANSFVSALTSAHASNNSVSENPLSFTDPHMHAAISSLVTLLRHAVTSAGSSAWTREKRWTVA